MARKKGKIRKNLDIIALVIAVLSVIFAGWSVYETHLGVEIQKESYESETSSQLQFRLSYNGSRLSEKADGSALEIDVLEFLKNPSFELGFYNKGNTPALITKTLVFGQCISGTKVNSDGNVIGLYAMNQPIIVQPSQLVQISSFNLAVREFNWTALPCNLTFMTIEESHTYTAQVGINNTQNKTIFLNESSSYLMIK